MIFGEKTDFAIEAMIEPDLVPPSLPWGRLCIWVAGTQLGDFEDQHCSLYLCYKNFQEKCGQWDQLWLENFRHFSDIEIWNFLDGLLYGYHGNMALNDNRSLAEITQDCETYSKFGFLTNWGEMFDDGGKSFIVRPPDERIKILNYDYERERVNTYLCSETSFSKAATEFAAWYAAQSVALNSEKDI